MANPSTSTSLRRSQRLLLQSTKATTTTTPISSSVHIKTLFNSPPSSLTQQDLSLKKTRQRPTAKISKNSIGSSGIPKKSINGLTKSTEMINGVEGFLRLRRSPRFSNIGLNITDKEVVESRKRKTRQSIEKDESKQGVNCGIEARSKSEQCKENFRYPLRSIGNILGRPNGNGGEVKKSVKSIYRSSEPIHGGSRQSKNRKNVLIDLFDQEIALDVTKKGHVEEEERTLTLALIGSDKAIGEMKVGVGAPSSKDNIRKIEGPRMPNSLVVFREGGANTSRNANMQIKEISNQSGNQGGLQEWTEDQELALQRAYLAAKPSPHFWKKVSKLRSPQHTARSCSLLAKL